MSNRLDLRRGTTALCLAAALAVGVAACGDDEPSGPGTAEIGEGVTALDPAETTTTATTEAPATTTTLPPPTGRADAAEAAQVLYDSWVAGDRATAATVAEPAAIDAVFGSTPGPYQLYRGCDTGEFDTGGCLFRDRSTNNTIQVNVERRDGGWVVTGAMFSAG